MDNEEIENDNIIDDGVGTISTTALEYDYYSYSDVVTRLDTVITNQNNEYELLNQSIGFISFMLVIFLVYNLIRNMIRK